MKIFILAILLLQVLSIKVDPNNTLFVDQYNRYTVYHGVNAIQKAFPFYPQMDYFDSNSSLNDEDLFNLYGWGFNVVRLHVAWEGV